MENNITFTVNDFKKFLISNFVVVSTFSRRNRIVKPKELTKDISKSSINDGLYSFVDSFKSQVDQSKWNYLDNIANIMIDRASWIYDQIEFGAISSIHSLVENVQADIALDDGIRTAMHDLKDEESDKPYTEITKLAKLADKAGLSNSLTSPSEFRNQSSAFEYDNIDSILFYISGETVVIWVNGRYEIEELTSQDEQTLDVNVDEFKHFSEASDVISYLKLAKKSEQNK